MVTIIIPVYNGANYLSKSIECALNQTYRNIELVIVNDGSTEAETEQIALQYQNKDHRVKYFYKENGGVATAVNYGVEKATGEYVCWLSHDDLMPLDKMEGQIRSISKLGWPEKTITYGKNKIIDENGKVRRLKTAIFTIGKGGFKKPVDFFRIKRLIYSTLLIPRSFLLEHPMVPELRYSQDFFSFFQMLEAGYQLKYVKTATTYYRVHRSQGSFKMAKEFEHDTAYRHEVFINYIKKTNDLKFLKKYFVNLSEKAGGFEICNTLYHSMLNDELSCKLPKCTLVIAKIRVKIYRLLFKIKRAIFGR